MFSRAHTHTHTHMYILTLRTPECHQLPLTIYQDILYPTPRSSSAADVTVVYLGATN